jgi:hypothetical protein
MEKHTHEEHIVGKSGDYTAKGNIGDTWEKVHTLEEYL